MSSALPWLAHYKIDILKNKLYLLLRAFYIIACAAVIVIMVIYFLKKNVDTVSAANEEVICEKILTKTDSMIFRYDTMLTEKLKSAGTVGAALAITYKGEIAYLKCFGLQKKGEQNAINENTVFRLASVSKTVTGALAGILSSEKTIPLDNKVIAYLPEFYLKDSINTADLTVRNILSHTSGLVPHAYDNLVEAQVPMKVIIDSLRLVNIAGIPGEYYGYQNVVFSMYDTIAEVKTRLPFSELIKKRVFTPFGMDDASVDFESFSTNPNIAYPHFHGKVLKLNNRYYNTKPAAGINASISDMANFLLTLTDYDSTSRKKDVFKEVLSPQVLSPLRRVYLRQWKGVESKHYGLGWRIIGYNGKQIAYHGGYVQGYRAEIALCRDEEIGIVYLTNSPGSVGSWVVPTFLDMYFGENVER
jgi:beta-lactamase class C